MNGRTTIIRNRCLLRFAIGSMKELRAEITLSLQTLTFRTEILRQSSIVLDDYSAV